MKSTKSLSNDTSVCLLSYDRFDFISNWRDFCDFIERNGTNENVERFDLQLSFSFKSASSRITSADSPKPI